MDIWALQYSHFWKLFITAIKKYHSKTQKYLFYKFSTLCLQFPCFSEYPKTFLLWMITFLVSLYHRIYSQSPFNQAKLSATYVDLAIDLKMKLTYLESQQRTLTNTSIVTTEFDISHKNPQI